MKTAKTLGRNCGSSRKMKHSAGMKKAKAASSRSKGNRKMLTAVNAKYRK